MKFKDAVKQLRLAKKRVNPQAYTQAACGSRMTDRNGDPAPVGQVGWSRYETEDYTPEYNTVVGIANALQVTAKERQELYNAAGYDVRQMGGYVEEYRTGQTIATKLSDDQREKLVNAARKAQEFLDSLGDILNVDDFIKK